MTARGKQTGDPMRKRSSNIPWLCGTVHYGYALLDPFAVEGAELPPFAPGPDTHARSGDTASTVTPRLAMSSGTPSPSARLAASRAAAAPAMTPLPPCPASHTKLFASGSGPITGSWAGANVLRPPHLCFTERTS